MLQGLREPTSYSVHVEVLTPLHSICSGKQPVRCTKTLPGATKERLLLLLMCPMPDGLRCTHTLKVKINTSELDRAIHF